MSWSDGGALSHWITVGPSAMAIDGVFKTEYRLTTSRSPVVGGIIVPLNGTFHRGWVDVTATPAPGYAFVGWTGPVLNTVLASTAVLMNAPTTIAAKFALNVTSRVSVTPSTYVYNLLTLRYLGTATITNTSAVAINAPLQLLLTNLTAGVTLANATGSAIGSPYLTANVSLAPGASTVISVQFSNPANVPITYTPMVLSGAI